MLKGGRWADHSDWKFIFQRTNSTSNNLSKWHMQQYKLWRTWKSKQVGAIHNKNLFWTHEHNSFPYRTTVTWRDYTNANYNTLNFHVKLCAYTTGPMYFILNLLKKTFKFMIRYTKIIESTYSKNLSNPSLMNISINLDNYLLMIL